MSQARAPCPNCDLPFYAGRNTACPYCGTPAADATGSTTEEADLAGGTATAEAARPRTECPDCGLPYYEDDDGCPYCAAATAEVEHDHERDEPTEDTHGEDDVEEVGHQAEDSEGAAEHADAAVAGEGTGTDSGESASEDDRSGSGGLLGFLRGLFGR